MKEDNLKDVVICKECGVLFIPKEKHFHTCKRCFTPAEDAEDDIYYDSSDVENAGDR